MAVRATRMRMPLVARHASQEQHTDGVGDHPHCHDRQHSRTPFVSIGYRSLGADSVEGGKSLPHNPARFRYVSCIRPTYVQTRRPIYTQLSTVPATTPIREIWVQLPERVRMRMCGRYADETPSGRSDSIAAIQIGRTTHQETGADAVVFTYGSPCI